MICINQLKNISILVSTLFILSACGGGGSTTVASTSSTTETSNEASQSLIVEEPETITNTLTTQKVCKAGTASQQGQITDANTKLGLADVLVNIDGCSTTTDENGYYALNNITEREKAVVNFTKIGYPLASTPVKIKKLSGDNTPSLNYLETSLHAYDSKDSWSYDSQMSTSGVFEAEASIYTDLEGKNYTGTILANWSFNDTMTEAGRDSFVGSYEGKNSNGIMVSFVSYGHMSLKLSDEKGSALKISEKIILTLDSVTGSTENIIPLWYYDVNQGLWIEEGYAQRQSNGTYKAEVARTGTWTLSQAIEEEHGIYRGHIIAEDGTAVSDVRLYALGENWVNSDLSTDENGLFELNVIPDSSFRISAYNYKDKYSAKYSIVISPIASGDIVE